MPETLPYLAQEIGIRLILLLTVIFAYFLSAFERKIQPEEWWLYKYPVVPNFLIIEVLFLALLITPFPVVLLFYHINEDGRDLRYGYLALTLAMLLNDATTHFLKALSGRMRPNFFFTCFPEGFMYDECTGDPCEVDEARKSFPSGHASLSFTSMVFLALYLCGKLNVFTEQGQGQSWRLLLVILPIFAASVVAVSRTCNYQHHWEDIIFGAILGTSFAYICYRLYYPSIFDTDPGIPHQYLE